MQKKLLSIVTPCYNEEQNIYELYSRIIEVINTIPKYDFEIIVIDNSSTDGSLEILKNLASMDKRLKVIENMRNLGLLVVGAAENVIRFLPPLTVSEHELNEALGITEAALKKLYLNPTK